MLNFFKKFIFILGKEHKLITFFVICLMLFGTLVEVASLGMVIPLVSSLNDPSYLEDIFFLNYFNSENKLLVLFLFIILIFLFKTFFFVVLNWFQSKLNFLIQRRIASKLFSIYLSKKYSFFINTPSSKIIRNIVTETAQITENTIKSFMILLTDTMVGFGILLFLLYIEPLGTIFSISILIAVFFIFNKNVSKITKKLGDKRLDFENRIIKNVQEAIGGIKEIKLYNLEDRIYYNFMENNIATTNVKSYQDFILSLPRLLAELTGIIVLILFIIIISNNNDYYSNILPSLALFAAAFFKMIPNINRMQSSLLNIKYTNKTFNDVYNEIKNYSPPIKEDVNKVNFQKKISLSNIEFSYDKKNLIFTDLNLNLEYGYIYGISGESGSGKSTLVDLIMGFIMPEKGSIIVDNVDISKNILAWQKNIAYVPQNIFLNNETLLENIIFSKDEKKIDHNLLNEIIKKCQLNEFINSLPNGINSKVGELGNRLSGGQKQRIGIARSLYRNSSLLILDESTNSLDKNTEDKIIDIIFNLKNKVTVILISHDLNLIKKCDKIINIKNNKVEIVDE